MFFAFERFNGTYLICTCNGESHQPDPVVLALLYSEHFIRCSRRFTGMKHVSSAIELHPAVNQSVVPSWSLSLRIVSLTQVKCQVISAEINKRLFTEKSVCKHRVSAWRRFYDVFPVTFNFSVIIMKLRDLKKITKSVTKFWIPRKWTERWRRYPAKTNKMRKKTGLAWFSGNTMPWCRHHLRFQMDMTYKIHLGRSEIHVKQTNLPN